MRVYVPATFDMLGVLAGEGTMPVRSGVGFALTPALREFYTSGDEEEIGYQAFLDAARASLRLLAIEDEERFPARRVVLSVDVDDDKLALARRMGATHTINSAQTDATAAVMEITGGRGVDAAFEALGSAVTTRQATEVAREGGRVVVVGIPPAGTSLDADLARIVRRKIQIKGSYGARARQDVPALIRLLAAGKLDLGQVISRRVPMAEAPRTYEALDRGEVLGRAIVLTGD